MVVWEEVGVVTSRTYWNLLPDTVMGCTLGAVTIVKALVVFPAIDWILPC